MIIVLFSSDIAATARLGRRISFPHPVGIVIGKGVKVGDDTVIFQQVTLGGDGSPGTDVIGYPTIGCRVVLYSKCSVIGGVTVGDGAVIGAHALVNSNLNGKTVYAGVPARPVRSLAEIDGDEATDPSL